MKMNVLGSIFITRDLFFIRVAWGYKSIVEYVSYRYCISDTL